MNSSPGVPHSRSKTCNSFRRTLLRRTLHKFSAVAPVTHLDGIIYRRNVEKTRKSFRRLLLSLFVPVSPLGAHSYKKIGGGGAVLFRQNPWPDVFKISKSFVALLLPALFPVSPLLHYSYKKIGAGGAQSLHLRLLHPDSFHRDRWFRLGWRGVAILLLPTSNLEPPTSRPRPIPPLSKSLPAGRQALESHSYINIIFLARRAPCVSMISAGTPAEFWR